MARASELADYLVEVSPGQPEPRQTFAGLPRKPPASTPTSNARFLKMRAFAARRTSRKASASFLEKRKPVWKDE